MKLLLDEMLPKRLRLDLVPHEASTVREMGWDGKGNGELLELMKENGCNALITFDKNLEYQQNFERYDLPVIVLDAVDNTHAVLAPLMPKILALLSNSPKPGPHAVR